MMELFTSAMSAAMAGIAGYMACKGIKGWGWFLFVSFLLAGFNTGTTLIDIKA